MSSVSDEEVQEMAKRLCELLRKKLFPCYFEDAARPWTRLWYLKLTYQAPKKLLSKLEKQQGINYIKPTTSKKLINKMAQFDQAQLGFLNRAFQGKYDKLEQNLQLESGSFGVEVAVGCPSDPDSEMYWYQVVSRAPPEQADQQFEEWKAEARRLGIYPDPNAERAMQQITSATLGPAFAQVNELGPAFTQVNELLTNILKRKR